MLKLKLARLIRIVAVAFIIAIVFSIGVFNFPVGAVTRDLYWVPTGGVSSGNWSNTAHWSLASGGAGGEAVPDSDDNVVFDDLSDIGAGFTVTVDATAYCLDFTNTLVDQIMTLAVGANILYFYDDVVFKADTVITGTGSIASNGAGGASLTTNTASIGCGIGCAGAFTGTLDLMDNITTTTKFMVNGGTLNTNGFTITAPFFTDSASVNAKTLNLGASIITLSSLVTDGWSITGTNETINAGTSVIAIAGAGDFVGSDQTYHEVQLNGTAHTVSGANVFNDLIRTGTASTTDTLSFAGDQTITNFTLAGNSAANRLTVNSSVHTTQRTLTSAVNTFSNADFHDIKGAGAGSWDVSAIAGSSADLGNNSGITFAHNAYWVGNSGNWGNTTHWSGLSGGSSHTNWYTTVTNSQTDYLIDVYFDANSFTIGGQAMTQQTAGGGSLSVRCHNMDWTGALNSPTYNIPSNSSSRSTSVYGDLTFISAMQLTLGAGFVNAWYFENTGAASIDAHGKFGSDGSTETYDIKFENGGTYTLTSDLVSMETCDVYLTLGTLNTAGFSINCDGLRSSNNNVRVLNFGASSITCNYVEMDTATNLTFNLGSATIVDSGNWTIGTPASFVCGTSTISCAGTFAGGSNTYNSVTLTGNSKTHTGNNTFTTLVVSGASPTISGSNTIGTGTFTGGGTITLSAANTFTNWTVTGTASLTDNVVLGGNQTISGTLTLNGNASYNRLLVKSSVPKTARTLTVTTLITASNVDFLDITGVSLGAANWDLSSITGGSGNLGSNVGITFTVATSQYWRFGGVSWNWEDPTNWSSTVGGVGGSGHMPYVQDTAIFDVDSILIASRTVTVGVPYIGNINTEDIAFVDTNIYSASTINIYGNTINFGTHIWTTVSGTYFMGRANPILNSGGTTITGAMYSQTYTGSTLTLQADLTVTGAIYLRSGTLDFYTWDVTASSFDSTTTTYARVLTLGTGWVVLNSTAAISKWAVDTGGAGLTVQANTATIALINAGANGQTFAGGGVTTYYNLYITGAGAYILTFTGNNTFNLIYVDRSLAAKTLAGATTQTINQMSIPKAGTTVVTITNLDFVKAAGIFVSQYLSISGSTVTAATFYAGTAPPSTDGGGNVGWIFTDYALPIVSTLAASGVDDFSANLNASLDGMGIYTTLYVAFEHGTTTGYGYTTAEQTLSAVDTFTQAIAGLSSGTTYHYRGRARYMVGGASFVVYGLDMVFKTTSLAGAPIVITGDAIEIDATTATFVGSLVSVGDYSLTTIAVAFEYCTDGLFSTGVLTTGYQTLAALTSYTKGVTGLTANTTYYVRAVALYILGSTNHFAYGGSVAFVTLAASGASLVITVDNAAVFSGYLVSNDLLFCAQVFNKYTGYYPNKPASQYFQIQLLDPTGVTILGAVPLWDYGTVPVSIYFNATQAAAFTNEGLYQIKMTGLFTAPPSDIYTLTAADWKGSNLNNLDDWMISVAKNINTNNNWDETDTQFTLAKVPELGTILSDAGGTYFTSGIAGITSVRPDMFTQSKGTPTLFTGSANNVYDQTTWISAESYVANDLAADAGVVYDCTLAISGSTTKPSLDAAHWSKYTTWIAMTPYILYEVEFYDGLAYYCNTAYAGGAANPSADGAHWTLITYPSWVAQVGTKIASDSVVFGNVFNIQGGVYLGYLIWVLIFIVALVGASKGAGALGTLLLTSPFLFVGNYFRVIGIQVTVVVMVLCIILWVRQFWIKTT